MKVQTEHIMDVSGGGVRGHWTRKEIPMVGKLNPACPRLVSLIVYSQESVEILGLDGKSKPWQSWSRTDVCGEGIALQEWGCCCCCSALGRKCQEEMRSNNGSTYTLALKYDSRLLLDKDLK